MDTLQSPLIQFATLSTTVLGLLLGSCNVAPSVYDPASHDYRVRHQTEVKPVVARVSVEFEKSESRVPENVSQKLEEYFAAYLRAGRSRIDLMVYEDGSDQAILLERASAVEAFAIAQGVRRNEISSRIEKPRQDQRSLIEMAFQTHIVRVPECGDWSRDNLASFDNSVPTNFGCALQANLGKMVTDPGDLVRRRDETDPDRASVARVIGRHQAGETPSSADNSAGPASALGATE